MQLDFVIGIEIMLSNNHPKEDICDDLAGVYPKTFKFVGWHPFCRCIAVPKLADEDEFIARQQALIDGQDVPEGDYTGEVTEMPEVFNKWVQDNAERIENAKSVPYFISDNAAAIENIVHTSTHTDAISMDHVDNSLMELAGRLGIKCGKSMTFEQANELRANPNYRKAVKYRQNCQSAVVANELRRQGLDVEAYGNTKEDWHMPSILAKRPEIAFLDASGEHPAPIKIRYHKDLMSSLNGQMTEVGRYHIRFRFANDGGDGMLENSH